MSQLQQIQFILNHLINLKLFSFNTYNLWFGEVPDARYVVLIAVCFGARILQ